MTDGSILTGPNPSQGAVSRPASGNSDEEVGGYVNYCCLGIGFTIHRFPMWIWED